MGRGPEGAGAASHLPARRAFTLVEALLATTLISLALVQAWDSLRLQDRVQNRVDREAGLLADLSALSQAVSEDAQTARAAAIDSSGTLALVDGAGRRIEYKTVSRRLTRSGNARRRVFDHIFGARFEIDRLGNRSILFVRIALPALTPGQPRGATFVRLLPEVARS